MPTIKRRSFARRDWNDIHRGHLRHGAIASHQRFGEPLRVSCRGRDYDIDFSSDTMPTALLAWQELKDELLATVDDPKTLWGHRRFECQD